MARESPKYSCATRPVPEPECYLCYSARPEPEYYLCFPAPCRPLLHGSKMWHSKQKQTETVEMRRYNHTGNQRRELKICDTLSKTVFHKILSVYIK
jgi:hypothetical protein